MGELPMGAKLVLQAVRLVELEAEVACLREALQHVEWTSTPYLDASEVFCPWCGTTEEEGHRFDCMRQAALEPRP